MKTPAPQHVVVVGASAAGLSAVEALRRGGYTNKITMIGAEKHQPYDRPPLSKQFLSGDWDRNKIMLRPNSHLHDLDVSTRFGIPALDLDVRERQVLLADGASVGFDRLILATGVSPKSMAGAHGLAGIHTLKTLDEATALRDEIRACTRMLVIGSGFLGTEVAAQAAASSVDVTLFSRTDAPLARALGPSIGAHIAELHRKQGVTVRSGGGAAVASFLGNHGRVTGIALTNGEVLTADLVVIAVGSRPAVDWLRGSGLHLDDGVSCAADSSAGPGIYAAGDVARWYNSLFDINMRVEHRTNAVDQGIHVAEQIVAGTRDEYTPVPYFWSDQHDLKLQSFGWLRDHDEMLITEGSIEEKKFVALYRRKNRLIGVLGARSQKSLRTWRHLIAERVSWKEALTSR